MDTFKLRQVLLQQSACELRKIGFFSTWLQAVEAKDLSVWRYPRFSFIFIDLTQFVKTPKHINISFCVFVFLKIHWSSLRWPSRLCACREGLYSILLAPLLSPCNERAIGSFGRYHMTRVDPYWFSFCSKMIYINVAII